MKIDIVRITERFSEYSFFQKQIVELVVGEFDYISHSLHEESSFLVNEKLLNLSFVHKSDVNSVLTYNIHRDYLSIWYGECNYTITTFDNDFLSRVVKYLFGGRYFVEEYFRKKRKTHSITKVEDSLLPDMIIYYSFFFQILKNLGISCADYSQNVRYANFYEARRD